jgi:hypothetical protein
MERKLTMDEMHFGEFESPKGFVFGIQGFKYSDPIVRTVTWFIDNTALVADQYGRCIKGILTKDAHEILFAPSAPDATMPSGAGIDLPKSPFHAGRRPPPPEKRYATHLEVYDALIAEGVDIRKLSVCGWPQLPYDLLVELKDLLPPVPIEQLHTIKAPELRKDALRMRLEMDTRRDEQRAREEMEAQRELEEALELAKAKK